MLFAVLDESERLLGEIDALSKEKQQKVSPMLGFMSECLFKLLMNSTIHKTWLKSLFDNQLGGPFKIFRHYMAYADRTKSFMIGLFRKEVR